MFYVHNDVIDVFVVVTLPPAEDSGEVIPRPQGQDTNVRRTLKNNENTKLWL